MDLHRKILRALFSKKAVPWVLLSFLAVTLSAAILAAPQETAVPVGAAENISIYYNSYETASQENACEDCVNSKNVQKYSIRLYEGTIAIFEENNPTPLYRADTPVSRLPAADRLLLQRGLYAETLREAYRLIEDYE